MASLPDAVPSAANISYYLAIALEHYGLRKMIALCNEFSGRAYEFVGDVENFLEEFEREALGVTAFKNGGRRDGKLSQYLVEHQDRLERGWGGEVGLSTGLPELDDLLGGGMQSGEYFVVGAGPSVGKTTLAGNIVSHLARQGIPCGVFSFEMQGERIAARLASEQCGISARTARKGMDSEDQDRYGTSMKELNAWPVWICEEGSLTIGQIRSRARRWKAEHKVQLIVIDYIQLVESGTNARTRNDAITHVSRNCKAMAKELNIVLIVLAQLSREHKKMNRRPTLFDLRECGAIEADADQVVLLHPNGQIVEALVEKNRNESKGRVDLQFNAPIFRFEQLKVEEASI